MITSPDSRCAGLRVLIVEDDFLVARSLEILLAGLGCEVVGPASTAEEACQLIKSRPVDGALLDIALSPGTSAPVARALLYRDRPFVFVTGYAGIGMLPDDLRGYRVLQKPVDRETLASAVVEFARRSDRP
jgi:DNA-binding LytR/AlgR family response regulator